MENLVDFTPWVRPAPGRRGLSRITAWAVPVGGRAEAGLAATAPGEAVWRLLVQLPLDGGTRPWGRSRQAG